MVDAAGEGVGTDASEAGIEDAGGQDASVANNGEASVEDGGNPDAQLELDGAACSNARDGLGGIGVPPGTTATASASWNSTPANAIDGTLVTGWNAGNYTGWIALTFPAPVMLNGIALGAVSLPTTTETYTITGFQGGTSLPLGSWSDTVDTGFVVDLPPMLFAAGTYDGIRIDIQGNASWVSLNEISLLTVDCPAGPGGLYTVGTGAPIDAGPQAVDAGSQDGSSDAGSDGGSAEANACTLSAVATTPFLYGSAELSGTVGLPNGPPLLPSVCVELATSASSGSLTFAFTPTGCSFTYRDSNHTYTSNLRAGAMFDGDTYTCAYSEVSSTLSPYGPCPEISPHLSGLGASVTLLVTRSTGAVALSRQCTYASASCLRGGFIADGPTTEFALSGSLSCSDAGDTWPLTCGAGTCSAPDQACCTYPPGYPLPFTTGCVASGTSCPAPGQASACSGSESCPSGFVCCQPLTGELASGPFCQATSCPSGSTEL